MKKESTYQVIKEGSHVLVGELKPLQENFRPTGGRMTEVKEPIKDTALEKDYQDLVAKVNEHLAAAAAALDEAAILAAMKDSTVKSLVSKIENLSYDKGLDIPDINSYKLMRAIQNAGWSASSLSC